MSTPEALPVVGVDVAATRVHAVAATRTREGLDVTGFYDGPFEPALLVEFCTGARRVAVDGPGCPSSGAHVHDRSVAAKFRAARCSEIPVPGYPAVPWVTPSVEGDVPGWMRTAFAVWAVLVEAGLQTVETFPAACFHRLNSRRWPPPKTGAAGRVARVELLAGRLRLPAGAASWSHHLLDATAAALVAAEGSPCRHECPHPDGSVMWLLP